MKKYLLVFLLCFIATPAFANTTGHAWSESIGWFDFGDVIVTDAGLTGYAYNDNTGWLSFDEGTTVTNTNGDLSGFAWSESVGWFDFSNVTISDGTFSGYAYNDNTGWLSFESPVNVTTTWAPASDTPSESSSRSSGSSVSRRIKNLVDQGKTQEAEDLQKQFPNAKTITPPSQTGLRTLKQGDVGNDVKALQIILNLLGYTVAPTGLDSTGSPRAGSMGNETTLFGSLTQQALIRYQQANNITPAVGQFGPITQQSIINKLVTLLTS